MALQLFNYSQSMEQLQDWPPCDIITQTVTRCCSAVFILCLYLKMTPELDSNVEIVDVIFFSSLRWVLSLTLHSVGDGTPFKAALFNSTSRIKLLFGT